VLEETSWSTEKIILDEGDNLVLYTDGITDAMNAADQSFGQERLQEVIRQHTGKTAQDLLVILLDEVKTWQGETPQFDDITLMVITRGQGDAKEP
jgi:sigma-B regulation protein RsbU (phosphoserine phosphatase)